MMSAKFPDFVETDLNIINALSFRLPATAVGIDSNKIMEIVVEYGENPTNTSDLIANAWAREVGAVISGFIASVHLPVQKNEPPMEQANRILAALNESETFEEQLSKFIAMLIKKRAVTAESVIGRLPF